MAALVASWWTNWSFHCCCVPAGSALNEAPVGQLDSNWLVPDHGVCGASIHGCGKQEEIVNARKWDVQRNI